MEDAALSALFIGLGAILGACSGMGRPLVTRRDLKDFALWVVGGIRGIPAGLKWLWFSEPQ